MTEVSDGRSVHYLLDSIAIRGSQLPRAVFVPRDSGRATGKRVGRPSPQRNKILEAAWELFAKSGYHGVSIDDIGGAVGLTGPSIYRHVGGKMELLVAVFDYVIENLLEAATSVCQQPNEPVDILCQLVDLHIDFVLSRPEYIQVYYQEENALPPAELERHRSKAGRYVDLWHEQLERVDPSLSLEERRVATLAAIAAMNFVGSRDWRAHPTREMMRKAAVGALFSQGSGEPPATLRARLDSTSASIIP